MLMGATANQNKPHHIETRGMPPAVLMLTACRPGIWPASVGVARLARGQFLIDFGLTAMAEKTIF